MKKSTNSTGPETPRPADPDQADKRMVIAAVAMHAMISGGRAPVGMLQESYATAAVIYADALLAALEQ